MHLYLCRQIYDIYDIGQCRLGQMTHSANDSCYHALLHQFLHSELSDDNNDDDGDDYDASSLFCTSFNSKIEKCKFLKFLAFLPKMFKR